MLQFINSESLEACPCFESICDYFHDRVQHQPPEQLLRGLVSLTQGKKDFSALDIGFNLENLSEFSFHRVLNHCCQILMSNWYQQPSNSSVIEALFIHLDSFENPCSRRFNRWEQWTQNFVKSSAYLSLKRVIPLIFGDKVNITPIISPNSLENLLPRYDFLYKHSFLNLDFHRNYRQMLSLLRGQKRKHFSFELTKYVTYRMRLLQILKARQLTQGAGRFLRPVPNPTLLNDRQLNNTLSLLTRTFQATSPPPPQSLTLITLLNYLLSDLSEKSSRHRPSQFKQSLFVHCQSLLSEVSQSTFSESSLLEGGRRLLNFLICDNSSPEPSSFLPTLLTFLDADEIVNLLLKLIQLSPQLKPTLDLKLFQLFDHYKLTDQTEIKWLINLLETYLIALSIFNQDLDLSTLKLSLKS